MRGGSHGAVTRAAAVAGKDDDTRTAGTPAAVADTSTLDSPSPSGDAAPSRGTLLGRYIILDRIGAGGMGVVYAAYDPELERKIAIKLLRSGASASPESRARLLREAQAMARVSHPNVIHVYDVGTLDARQVFIAMELVRGQTLTRWLRERSRSWHDVLRMFAQAGRGLVAAHAVGLVHRDFKPDNVLVDDEGRVRVLDFGLVSGARAGEAPLDEATRPSVATPLTRSGALLGTPAYMAPEQLRGAEVDQRSDQFAFCVALFEGLYGLRPFTAGTTAEQLERIEAAALAKPPSPSRIPERVYRLLARGLSARPELRHPSLQALLDALPREPTPLGRRWRIALMSSVPVLLALGYGGARLSAHQRLATAIARHVAASDVALARARDGRGRSDALRARAFAAFDAGHSHDGEAAWDEVLAVEADTDADYRRAAQSLEAAVALDGTRRDTRRRFADVLEERAALAERNHRLRERDEIVARMLTYDDDGTHRARWSAPAQLTLATMPAGLTITAQRYVDEAGRRHLTAPETLGVTPLDKSALTPGSYLLTLHAGDITLRYPLVTHRGETLRADVAIPAHVPEGYVFVPAGRFFLGSNDDENMRRAMLLAPPLHETTTGAYLIGRYEVTFAEWIAFLRALPPAERAQRRPRGNSVASAWTSAQIELVASPADEYRILLQPTKQRYEANETQSIHYPERTLRADQRWLRMPVSGISWDDARAYAAWLDRSGRLPGARACNERELERAARGADDRLYPHGDRLEPDDANFDATYGRKPLAFGPDEVGSHPASDSPFGVSDLAGNVWEWAASASETEAVVMRGGCWYIDRLSSRSNNREAAEPTLRRITIGFRVCASVSGGEKGNSR
jgi:formylglycine-generating enzyme required for sulfatase activity